MNVATHNQSGDLGSATRYVVEFLTDDVVFDPLSLYPAALFTQSDLYFRWQLAVGKKTLRFLVRDGSSVVAYAQCFFVPLRFLGGRGYWYSPYGPVCVPGIDQGCVSGAVRSAFADRGDIFFRCDFSPAYTKVCHFPSSRFAVFSTTPQFLLDGSVQPRSEWILPLDPSEPDLLTAMHPKTRYAIQYAQRKGVSVQIVSDGFNQYFEPFCTLMHETSRRDGFVSHSDTYYKALFSELERNKQGFLVVGLYSGIVVSIALIIGYSQTATYVFGASSNTHRNVSASAFVQWQAVLEAKRRGFSQYSFGGVSSEQFPVKTWTGITMFKQRFGGHEQNYSPIADIVFEPAWYLLYALRRWAKRYLHI